MCGARFVKAENIKNEIFFDPYQFNGMLVIGIDLKSLTRESEKLQHVFATFHGMSRTERRLRIDLL